MSGDKNSASLADGPVALGTPFMSLEFLSCRVGKTGEIFARYKIRKDK